MTSSWGNCSPKGPPPDTITWGVRFRHTVWGGHRHAVHHVSCGFCQQHSHFSRALHCGANRDKPLAGGARGHLPKFLSGDREAEMQRHLEMYPRSRAEFKQSTTPPKLKVPTSQVF